MKVQYINKPVMPVSILVIVAGGNGWQIIPHKFAENSGQFPATNIIITCTDNVASRRAVHAQATAASKAKQSSHENKFHYWLDMGNTKDRGQVILGSPRHKLPTVIDKYPEAEKMEAKDDTPSCSIAEALAKQDLFVNTFMADTAAKLLWEMFIAPESIDWCGAYINCTNLNIKKIAA